MGALLERPHRLRPEGPKGGMGIFGEGAASPHQLRGLGERCELPQRGSGRFFYNLSALDGFSCEQNLLSRRIFITIIYLFCTL